MPIVVEHALPVTGLGKLAFETGAGIREQKLIERSRDDFWKGREFALRAAQVAQQGQQQAMAFQERQLAREMAFQEQQQKAVELAHTEIEDALVGFEKQAARQQFTPEGQRIFRDLGSKWAGIQKNRARLNPQQYRQVLQQFRGEMAAARLANHTLEPESVQDMVAKRVFPLPDGSGSWVQQPDGNLEFKTHRDWQSELFAKMQDKEADRQNKLAVEAMKQDLKKADAAKKEAKDLNTESDRAETAFRLATSTYLDMRARREEAAAKAATDISKADADFAKAYEELKKSFNPPKDEKGMVPAAYDKNSKFFEFPPDSVEAAKLNALQTARDAAKEAAQARIDKANQDAELAQKEWDRASKTIEEVRAKRQAWADKQAAEEAAAAQPQPPPAGAPQQPGQPQPQQPAPGALDTYAKDRGYDAAFLRRGMDAATKLQQTANAAGAVNWAGVSKEDYDAMRNVFDAGDDSSAPPELRQAAMVLAGDVKAHFSEYLDNFKDDQNSWDRIEWAMKAEDILRSNGQSLVTSPEQDKKFQNLLDKGSPDAGFVRTWESIPADIRKGWNEKTSNVLLWWMRDAEYRKRVVSHPDYAAIKPSLAAFADYLAKKPWRSEGEWKQLEAIGKMLRGDTT